MSVASLFGFGTPAEIQILFNNQNERQLVDVRVDKERREKMPLYYDGETVAGKVIVRVKDGRKLEHNGIKVEFVGSIELFYDRGNRYEFTSLVQELAVPGEMRQNATYDFEFKNVEKQFESYHGINVKLRYYIRATISRRFGDLMKERDLWVYSYRMPPEINNSIKMEVGIEDCLHIEFEYNKSKYSLKDVIVGKIYFLLVRIKIKHMELSIIRRETTGAAPNQYNESETITKFEIMDGAPVRGETIPIRLFLGGFELTPTYRDVNKKFSTRYYLNLVLIDEENRRYFKQQEITIYRKPDGQTIDHDETYADHPKPTTPFPVQSLSDPSGTRPEANKTTTPQTEEPAAEEDN
ncbi:Vacuolar protein sorting-associated protein 26 [Dimargaris cristalligena]|uniref:Putative PEP8-vacuolar protein sorting/targeting protein n=1 Tax=Dimargaris cristalligena TaxID=215637 RepID=A0A4P9ZU65_9FUNG|nr:Vacuolar protein sorting-associated protein 26 [Dimargaris cristalligena]RKP37136.1 putative PEP8-vacuolar protein sorting/targeting protein [Dimargaris cristalligena]|eukprot:RKP37136.1 putative PEP8-vacuolar protein sorting/targeting protein [Dimargaris cristalligena]